MESNLTDSFSYQVASTVYRTSKINNTTDNPVHLLLRAGRQTYTTVFLHEIFLGARVISSLAAAAAIAAITPIAAVGSFVNVWWEK